MRFVAVVSGPDEPVCAYILLWIGARPSDVERYSKLGIPLSLRSDAALAPCVADEWQGRGLGSAMMRPLLDLARRLGVRRIVLWDGVMQQNARAVHFYTRLGFRKVGEFVTGHASDDMILEL